MAKEHEEVLQALTQSASSQTQTFTEMRAAHVSALSAARDEARLQSHQCTPLPRPPRPRQWR
eukprot:COSAG01_NODE_7497_length_3184_cov_1.594489_2_plen_62_part_00